MKEIIYSPESKEDLFKINDDITAEYGEAVAKKILTKITKTIRTLGIHEKIGAELSKQYGILCDYRYFYTQKNYIIYRIEGSYVKIIRVLNEKRDFMQILFGISTVVDDE